MNIKFLLALQVVVVLCSGYVTIIDLSRGEYGMALLFGAFTAWCAHWARAARAASRS